LNQLKELELELSAFITKEISRETSTIRVQYEDTLKKIESRADALAKINDELKTKNKRYYDVADKASDVIKENEMLKKELDKSKTALNEQMKKYDDLLSNKINKDTECTKLGKEFTMLKTDWETLNIQVTEFNKIIEDKDQQLRNLITEKEKMREYYSEELERSKHENQQVKGRQSHELEESKRSFEN